MHDRYRALRAVATVLRILAWIVAVFGILVVIAAALTTGPGVGDLPRLAGVVTGGVAVVSLTALALFAISALINLLIDIEANTRATVEILAHIAEQ